MRVRLARLDGFRHRRPGDMACHTVNMPFRALKLGYPTRVVAELTSQMFPETYAKTSRLRFEFPERGRAAAAEILRYDGSPGDKDLAPFVRIPT